MNSEQIQLVQQSFAKVQPIAAQAADMFYQRLFKLDPQLKKLFRGDMQEQGGKLMSMIAAAVYGLNHLDKLVPVLEALGQRHGGYGVKPADYDVVAQALLWTLQQGLKESFTSEVRAAWTAFYGVAASTMQGAAARAAA
jgi:hemoglobin-like flavoprotein